MRHWLLPLLLSFSALAGKAQQRGFSFTLEGRINADTGTIQLSPVGDPQFQYNHPEKIRLPVDGGKFLLRDSVLYPTAYRIFFYRGTELIYLSDFFLVDSGYQTVQCDVTSLRESPRVSNFSAAEAADYHLRERDALKEKTDRYEDAEQQLEKQYGKNIPDQQRVILAGARQELKAGKWVFLLTYTRHHPDSYVALWTLIRQLDFDGYQPVFDSVYAGLSPAIRQGYTGKKLGSTLSGARSTAVGRSFPGLPLLTVARKPKTEPRVKPGNQYLFVDFWFSHCGPCIGQFPALKKIYADYRQKGFDMMGISVDPKDQVTAWKTAINRYGLPWRQYLDLGGRESAKLSIDVMPSNFLLDASGKIIARDLSPEELGMFLEKHLPTTAGSKLRRRTLP